MKELENNWMKKWESVKEKTVCPVDLNTYFEQEEIAGKSLTTINIGSCDLPSGNLLVRDPLVYLPNRNERPYFQNAPAGKYETEICVIKSDDEDCDRYAAVRLRFNEKRAVRFYEALVGNENLETLEEGDYFGFCVDAGLGCVCDEIIHRIYCDWMNNGAKIIPMIILMMDILLHYSKKTIISIQNINVQAETG